jgi:hypothetical protein
MQYWIAGSICEPSLQKIESEILFYAEAALLEGLRCYLLQSGEGLKSVERCMNLASRPKGGTRLLPSRAGGGGVRVDRHKALCCPF